MFLWGEGAIMFRKRLGTIAVLGLASILLAGCATQGKWDKGGVSRKEYKADIAYCKQYGEDNPDTCGQNVGSRTAVTAGQHQAVGTGERGTERNVQV